MRVAFRVNDTDEVVEVEPHEVLLDTLRQKLCLSGTKDACREGECGACTVLVDGRPVTSCLYATGLADGRNVETIEGIAEESSTLARALLERGGIQCGFCTPGIVMVLSALLRAVPTPSEEEVRRALAGNLCRCTGYAAIVAAALEAAASRQRS
ncbi:MAG: 2Fe-2S iron-sulfur cluster binding domain-containing protein [Myxococcales bacterium]|nr:2Fe-2S iron-sulfur cluster binding domain-containing protein [Myxococcales bacterium]